VDDRELGHGGADVEPVVVDRQRDQPRLQPARAHGVGDLHRVLADDADRGPRVAARERLDEPREQELWAVLKVPSAAVPPSSRVPQRA
jgi:hypothetical protein